MTDHLTFQEALEHKAQGDAWFAHYLYRLEQKHDLWNKERQSGRFLGTTQTLAAGTPVYTAWTGMHDSLYVQTFLATWDELERQAREAEQP